MKTAQAALEFVMLVGLALIFLMIVIVIGVNLSAEHIANERSQRLLSFGYLLQNELIVTTSLQEGYSYDITIPERLGAYNLEITTHPTSFVVSSAEQAYTFLTPNLTGTFLQGTNTISYDGTLLITQ